MGPLTERLRASLVPLAVLAAIGMFLVLVMGATVTSTGSAEGCGRDWPLCHGRFIPEFAVATAIEFSHRAVTGVEGLLIVALVAGVLWLHPRDRRLRLFAVLMLVFLMLQAGMGAWAVKYPQQPVVLALHFGISLIAVASTAITALLLAAQDRLPAAPSGRGALLAAGGLCAYLYLLVYSGAFIRHIGGGGACAAWPLCPSGGPAGAVAINLAHRSGAGLALVAAVGLWLYLRPAGPALASASLTLIVTLLAQAAAGAYLALSGFSLLAELLHAGLTALVFTAAAVTCLLAYPGGAFPAGASLSGPEKKEAAAAL